MATCRDVISYAYRLLRTHAPGEEASTDEMADGLIALQGLIDAWIDAGRFGKLTDVYESDAYEAGEGERVITSSTVTLPTVIDDERAPYDLSLIEAIETGVRKVWLYDRTGWVRIDNLTLDTTCPLAARGMDGLAANVALRIGEMFGRDTIGPGLARIAGRFSTSIFMRLGVTQADRAGQWF